MLSNRAVCSAEHPTYESQKKWREMYHYESCSYQNKFIEGGLEHHMYVSHTKWRAMSHVLIH